MMMLSRLCAGLLLALCLLAPGAARAEAPEAVLQNWYRLILELVRHTPTYTPPVASRSFAYLGVTAYEAAAGGPGNLVTFAGQVNGLTPVPAREAGADYDEAVLLNAAMTAAVAAYFGNTGPTGQRAMAAMAARLHDRVTEGVDPATATRSRAYGEAVAAHVLAWSATDGGAVVENMGFPQSYTPADNPGAWVPTNATVRQQQAPLLPDWGKNRTFATPDGTTCPLPPPPAYSEDPASDFYREALEVAEAKAALTPEQIHIARSWSDDPMLSTTPPGHWVSIARQVMERDALPYDRQVEVHAKLGIGLADSFIGCWDAKFRYDLLRPVTYIRRVIDPKWEPLLITPPFPEYPSGHSTQSGAAAVILTDLFGENFAFEDHTMSPDGLAPRSFASFTAAAEEAGISRLYGGIHFRAAIVEGLAQGRCIGAYAVALTTRR